MKRLGKLFLVYLAGVGGLVVGFVLTVLVFVSLFDTVDPGHAWGWSQRQVNTVWLVGATVGGGVTVGLLLRPRRFWVPALATVLSAAVIQWVLWLILGTSDEDQSMISAPLGLLIGLWTASRISRSRDPIPRVGDPPGR